MVFLFYSGILFCDRILFCDIFPVNTRLSTIFITVMAVFSGPFLYGGCIGFRLVTIQLPVSCHQELPMPDIRRERFFVIPIFFEQMYYWEREACDNVPFFRSGIIQEVRQDDLVVSSFALLNFLARDPRTESRLRHLSSLCNVQRALGDSEDPELHLEQ